ncbi:MAG: hypothetical protein IJB89_04565 [Akkermansia sp.]|nr:hypothetical protein [Akkermansia sp.]MBQ9829805.1 hypothetical protein [Akkermansia sp.]
MSNTQKRPYRTISIIVPFNTPSTREKRQRNKKLYYLLRWLRYSLPRGNGNAYYRMEPQEAPAAMPHGAYRLQAQLQMKMDTFLASAPFAEFIARMQAEAIAPAVYLVEHKTNGEDVALPRIRICEDQSKELSRPIPMTGTEIDRFHTPCFARQMLTAPLDKPVDEYPAE